MSHQYRWDVAVVLTLLVEIYECDSGGARLSMFRAPDGRVRVSLEWIKNQFYQVQFRFALFKQPLNLLNFPYSAFSHILHSQCRLLLLLRLPVGNPYSFFFTLNESYIVLLVHWWRLSAQPNHRWNAR